MNKNNPSKNWLFNWLSSLSQSLMVMLMLMAVSNTTLANDLQPIIDDKQLALSVDVKSESIAPKQQVLVEVEISSTQPFEDAMVMPYLDLKNAVVKKDDQQVARSARMLDGQKWYTQTAKLYIYPLTAGTFVIPSFDVAVVLDNDKENPLKGTVSSEETTFNVEMPATLDATNEFVSGTDAAFTLKTDKPISDAFEVGEAVVLTYQLKVKNSHMMLLPDVNVPDIAGVEVYQKPVAKENIFDRLSKRNTAVLNQAVTVVFQESGKLVIPSQSIQWWDTKTNELKTLTTDPLEFQVGSSSALLQAHNYLEDITGFASKYGVYLIGLLVFVGLVITVVMKRKGKPSTQEKTPAKVDVGVKIKQYQSAVEGQRFAEAVDHLYLIAGNRTFTDRLDSESATIWKQLLSYSFANSDNKQPLTQQQAQILLSAVTSKELSSTPEGFDWRLNP
ncbi:hypothetical protein BCT94_11980 [Vibrio breoganii]|uniref:BatD family protein n=1 Tax=Vibrio breoganii TaxID=553239 RepID=UPI000C83DC32|nr:BatD family protein [Vibrio breoganii]PMK51872.1 hypothetical protein BCT98_16155 [Vibrio breoganii]PMK73413.1 hypothetical protein BCT94_11980 [Vibrio breoganii]TKG21913.1 protein BatD [Vibrio breoganii]